MYWQNKLIKHDQQIKHNEIPFWQTLLSLMRVKEKMEAIDNHIFLIYSYNSH